MTDVPRIILFESKDIREMSRDELIRVVEFAHDELLRLYQQEQRRLEDTVCRMREARGR